MCGLFGYIGSSPPEPTVLAECVALAATRGPHSHGMAWVEPAGFIRAVRGDGPAPPEVVDALPDAARVIVGHSRLATTGTYAGGAPKIEDTMPFIGRRYLFRNFGWVAENASLPAPSDDDPNWREVAIVHNGNVRKYRHIAERHALKLSTGCDSEVIAHLAARGNNFRNSLVDTIKIIDDGRPYAIIAISTDGSLAFSRRDRPLYLAEDDRGVYLCSRKPNLKGIDFSPAPSFFHVKPSIKEIAA